MSYLRTRPFPHFKFPEEITIEVKPLNDEEGRWYGSQGKTVHSVCTTNYGWFPTEVIAGIIKGRFSNQTPLARRSGWISGSGNLGSATVLVLSDKINECVKILKRAGYTVTGVCKCSECGKPIQVSIHEMCFSCSMSKVPSNDRTYRGESLERAWDSPFDSDSGL